MVRIYIVYTDLSGSAKCFGSIFKNLEMSKFQAVVSGPMGVDIECEYLYILCYPPKRTEEALNIS